MPSRRKQPERPNLLTFSWEKSTFSFSRQTAILPFFGPGPQGSRESMERSRLPLSMLVTVFLTGTCVMAVEMSASRLLQPYYGSSVYIWTNIIAVILTGLAAGYYLGGLAADRFPNPRVLSGLLLAGGLFVLLIPVLSNRIQLFFLPAFGDLPPRGAHGSVVGGSLASTMALFVVPVLFLGAIPPFAVKLLVASGRASGSASGTVLMLSTLGSIVGTFLPAHLTIPSWGTKSTFLAAGTTLVVLGGLGLFRTARRIPVWLLILALPGTFFAMLRNEPIRPTENSIVELESSYQYINVLRSPESDQGPATTTLTLDEGIHDMQSFLVEGEALTGGFYFDYYVLLPLLVPTDRPLEVLVLGAGANTIARSLTLLLPKERLASIDAVELDPEVVAVGRRHFDADFEPESPVVNHVSDGRVFLRSTSKRYDYIVVDAYAHQVYIPFHFTTAEFFSEVNDRLTDEGILAMNVSTFEADSPLLSSLSHTLLSVFPEAYAIPIIGGGWNQMLFAPRRPLARTLHDLEPSEVPPALELHRRRAADVTTALEASPAASIPAVVFTDDHAPVEAYLRAELRGTEAGTSPKNSSRESETSDPEERDPSQAKAWFDQFEAAWSTGKREEAIDFFRRSFRADPGAREFGSYAYGTFLPAGEVRATVDFFEEACARSPDQPDLHYYAGWTFYQCGNVPQAARALTRVTELEETAGNSDLFPRVWGELGFIRSCLGDLEGAEAAYRTLAERAPDHPTARDGLEGLAAIRRGRPRQTATIAGSALLLVFLTVVGSIWLREPQPLVTKEETKP